MLKALICDSLRVGEITFTNPVSLFEAPLSVGSLSNLWGIIFIAFVHLLS